MKWLSNVVNKGSANGLGFLLLMKAVRLLSTSCTDKARIREAFEGAVVSFTRSGIKSIAALANEKAGQAVKRLGVHIGTHTTSASHVSSTKDGAPQLRSDKWMIPMETFWGLAHLLI